MNSNRIGKIGVTLVLGILSAICGFVATEIVKESDKTGMEPCKTEDFKKE